MARDDFSKQTRDVLAKRVGVRCSNPNCRKLTTGPRSESRHIVNIGVAAHITAASEGGPRYDPSLTAEERQSPENGIWLCQNCAKLVDNDPTRYTAALLKEWKAQAEAVAQTEVEGSARRQPRADLAAELEISFQGGARNERRVEYRLEVALIHRGTKPLEQFHIDLEMPAAVIERARDNALYVPARSDGQVAFFRVNDRHHREPIYPGDTRVVMSVAYCMTHEIFSQRGDLLEQVVRATLYRPGLRPVRVERFLRDLQDF